jgi:hypothetical protein
VDINTLSHSMVTGLDVRGGGVVEVRVGAGGEVLVLVGFGVGGVV